jgi:hypothetical protein
MDDGSAEYSDNSYVLRISTYSFTVKEHGMLKTMLFDKFRIEMQLQPTPNRGFGVTTRFRTEDAKRLRELIAPHVPECMRYKIDYTAWLAKKMNTTTERYVTSSLRQNSRR